MNSMAMEALLGGTMVILAIRLLWTSDLFEGIVLFIVFGLLLTLVWAWLGVGLQISLGDPAEGSIGLAGRVAEALPRSGVASPITAVLLNFRAYDTFLEVGVLLAAWVVAVGLLARRNDSVLPAQS